MLKKTTLTCCAIVFVAGSLYADEMLIHLKDGRIRTFNTENIERIEFKQASNLPTKGLIAHFSMDGNISDLIDNANKTTNRGSIPTNNRSGNKKRALFFNGESYGSVSDSLAGLEEGTVSVWVRVANFSSRDNIGAIIEKTKTYASNFFRITIVMDNAKGGYKGHDREIEVRVGDNTFFSNNPISKNRWYHLAVTWGNGEHKLFVNGKKMAQVASNKYPAMKNYPIFFGVGSDGKNTRGDYFHGSIDDVRIYNRSLSNNEITLLTNE